MVQKLASASCHEVCSHFFTGNNLTAPVAILMNAEELFDENITRKKI